MTTVHDERRDWAVGANAVTPLSESVAAIAIIVLAVLGLVDVVPEAMLAIATIVVGVAILLQGAQTVGEYSRLITAGPGALAVSSTLSGGVTLEFLSGGVGIVLGILALFSHTPTLAPAALIVFGATLLLSGAIVARGASAAGALPGASPQVQAAQAIAAQMASVTSGAQIMIGIAAIVLGILALVPIHATILTLVGLLAVGAALLMAAVSTDGMVTSVFRG
jgi:uncharacterized membrane protein HdeD (DUF308 family)